MSASAIGHDTLQVGVVAGQFEFSRIEALLQLAGAEHRLHWIPDPHSTPLSSNQVDVALVDDHLFRTDSEWTVAATDHTRVPFIVLARSANGDEERRVFAAGACDVLSHESLTPWQLDRAIRHAVLRARAAAAEARPTHLRAILEDSVDPVVLIDDRAVIRFVSASVLRVTGFSAAEMIGRRAFDFMHRDDVSAVASAFQRSLATHGQPVHAEYRARAKNGTWQHREVIAVNRLADPAVGFVVVSLRDVTARKLAEAALVESEREYREMFDAAPLGIAHVGLDGRWVLVNSRICELLGHTSEELVRSSGAPPPFEDVQEEAQARAQLLQGATARYERRRLFRHKSGAVICTDATVSLRRGADGEPRGFILMLVDVTGRMRLEEQLRQTQKVEAIGRLAGGIAHDFNNLLTAIMGFTELASQELDSTHLAKQDVENAIAAARSAARLTRQLLAFSRRQVLQPQVLDLNEVVRHLEGMLRRLIGERIELSATLQPTLDRVNADRGQLEQVLVNLAVNGRDAMEAAGRLTIETANVDLDDTYTSAHPGSRAGPHVMLAVSDTGAGMDDSVRAHLFEPFYTTKGRGQGTGLGLATVYGIVKQSGGSIYVYSEPGQGSTFKVYLPSTTRIADPVIEALQPDDLAGSESILLAEDQAEVRRIATQALTRSGYTVTAAATGAAALRLVEDPGAHIDLLLTDVVMPGLSGRELAEQLRRLRPRLRVLYMSGYTDDVVIHHGVPIPWRAFIQKPFTTKALLQKVRELLDQPLPEE